MGVFWRERAPSRWRGLAGWSLAGAGALAVAGCFLPGIDPTGSGSGGSGGGSLGGPCEVVDDCPPQTCFAVVCDQGVCKYDPTPSVPAPAEEQVAGDCKVLACNASGSMHQTPDPNDPPDTPVGICKMNACDGDQPVVVDATCSGCCGTHDALNCEAGVCTGCTTASECGTDSFCGTFACASAQCSVTTMNEGEPCAPPTCSVGILPPEELENVSLCTLGSCEVATTSCGTYKCDWAAGICNSTCLDGDECQYGSECDGDTCEDCHTCAEVIGAGVVESCGDSKELIDNLKACYCQVEDQCSVECAGLCDPMTNFTQDCFLCLGMTPCMSQAAACAADTDPFP